MRRMFSEKQIKLLANENLEENVINFLNGKDVALGDVECGDLDSDGKITANEIIENMSGYSATLLTKAGLNIENVYTGIVKNGNKITIVCSLKLTRTANEVGTGAFIQFSIPESIGQRLYNNGLGYLDNKVISAFSDYSTSIPIPSFISKDGNTGLFVYGNAASLGTLTLNTPYYYRYEATYLLSDNLIS